MDLLCETREPNVMKESRNKKARQQVNKQVDREGEKLSRTVTRT